MRSSQVLAATRRVVNNQTTKILPPIPLYRRVLRAHYRHLDTSHRKLGDDYVKAEFRLHKSMDNPVQIVSFLSAWQSYAEQLEGDLWKDARLEAKNLATMTDDQVVQLYELMLAAKDKPSEFETGAN